MSRTDFGAASHRKNEMLREQRKYPVWAALEHLGVSDVAHVHGDRYQWMLCPFHPDTKPSARIKEFGFTCFACGVKGDAIKLIRDQEGVDYQTAVSILQGRVGDEDQSSAPERQFGQSLLG